MRTFINIIISIALFFVVIFSIVIIYAIVGDEKRDTMVEYYNEQMEYQNLMKIDGIIVDIDYRLGRSDTVKIIFYVKTDEKIKRLCLYSKRYYINEYDLYINTKVEIYYDTKKFGNNWIEPIFYIKSSTKNVMTYTVAKIDLLNWIKLNIGL